jgi:4-amino-4-deoxy-L-arabinose transferase-like glycosyltransferase
VVARHLSVLRPGYHPGGKAADGPSNLQGSRNGIAWASTEDLAAQALLYTSVAVAITVAAFALRLVLLNRYPFREDEAAYAYWALHGWFEDPMYLSVWPDKPPIYLWLLGAAFRVFGVSEAGARWVNVAASTLTVPIAAAIGRRLWGDRAALVAATVLALSPYAIAFSPTAYTDPVMVAAGLSALCAVVYERPIAAGLLLGVAIMTKQQGILFVPLVLGALWLEQTSNIANVRQRLRSTGLLVIGLAAVVLPILYWDSRRWAVAPSPWDLSVRNYAALELLAPGAWLARLDQWAPLLFDLTTSWTIWLLLAGLVIIAVVITYQQARGITAPLRHNATVFLIAGWSVCFLGIHVATTVQPWDRYLLPLAPMIALLAAWAADRASLSISRAQALVLAAMGFLLLLTPAGLAAEGHISVGGDHGDYAGLPYAIGAVRQASDGPLILYHRTLGTHFRFYLYGHTVESAQNGQIELRWFPSSIYLADNAAKTPYPRKLLIVPDWAPLKNLDSHLAMRGLAMTKLGRYGHFTLWEIAAEPSPNCEWCTCSQPAPWHEITGIRPVATPTKP